MNDMLDTKDIASMLGGTAPVQEPVPLLTDEEVQQLHNSTNAGNALIRLIEQMYRQKAGIK